MKTITTCFTISFSPDQLDHAKSFIEDMKKHPKRVFWKSRMGKPDEELIFEQLTHRVLSGYYGDEFFRAQKRIQHIQTQPNKNIN